jgi:D-xylose transport system substrate-binding protein
MFKAKTLLALTLTFLFALTGCVTAPPDQAKNANESTKPDGSKETGKKLKIGFSMATLKEERWVRDKDAFEKRCAELGVEPIVKSADNSSEQQAADVENLLTQKVDALLIAPNDATQAASMVEKAKTAGIPVISYDRLINSDKIDLYVSHQVPVIGKKMAEYALAKAPKGNYVMVYGDNADNNSHIMKKAMLEVLKPAIDKGDVKLVSEQHAKEWKREEALKIVENALTANNDNIQAIIASNDGTASGAISALETKGLIGKVLVTGQDAEKSALQAIAEGKQTMTVYKPLIPLANTAVDAAIKLAKKESLTGTVKFMNDKINKEVAAILLDIVSVDKDNLMATVIKDGFAKFEDVYANVPADQRPKQ